jgi:ATPase subunit of ABC transporter with duplicated ATPase domains
MLAASNIVKHHGPQRVLSDVTLVVPPGARIGLVGPNGVGKSTLLRILAGIEEPDAGRVRKSGAVAYLPQVAQSHKRSGGEAARAALAEVLLPHFDTLLLDEPTNDLDLDGLDRLERFVHAFQGGIVVVSHDRAFLDRTVTKIVELDEGSRGAREFAGGWSEYAAARDRARARHYERWESSIEARRRIEEQARQMRQWEERGYGQGRKKKKSKDVKKAYAKKLDRVERIDKPYEPWELRLDLAAAGRPGDLVLRLEGAVVERGAFRLGPLDLELARGERLALLGPNGSGKTTLLDALLGRLPLASGRRVVGTGVVFGELEQRRDAFDGDEPLVETFVRESGLPVEPARTLLAKFDLGADHVLRASGSLSPGERTRAVLALLSARRVNCLVLDEPTNHLDLEAIEQLETALAGYDGTVLLVTHDRRFLEAVEPTRTLELPPSRTPGAPSGPRRRAGRRDPAARASSS